MYLSQIIFASNIFNYLYAKLKFQKLRKTCKLCVYTSMYTHMFTHTYSIKFLSWMHVYNWIKKKNSCKQVLDD